MRKLFDLFYQCTGVSTDSRNISPGVLYIALKGERFNGNEFAIQALEQGALYAIVDEDIAPHDPRIHRVENGLLFLQQLANYHRSKFSIPFIGITGSNGKTTTKELIVSVLQQQYNVHYTKGNLNNHIGVPLTLLEVKNNHDIAVIEMGANKLNDIEELCTIAEPTHGIITNIGAAHLEGFGSLEGVKKTKKELYDAISKIGGTLFIHKDDPTLMQIAPQIEQIYYSSTDTTANVFGQLNRLQPEVVFEWSNGTYASEELTTQIIGQYNFTNILAAICIGNYFDVSPELINKGITGYVSDNNRSQVIKTAKNTIILDAYNANPTSVTSALKSFALIVHPDKFFILGDMLELGESAEQLHMEIIHLAESLGLQGIYIGTIYADIANKTDRIRGFSNKQEAMDFLSIGQPQNNLILMKGSRGIGLETMVALL
jgi:UDP-N-acetylmuramoyl-tripeptide--D-alanyl-D-alanine ligase